MQRALKRYFILISILLLATSLIEVQAESVSQFVSNEESIREEMITISRELGVTCTECHNVQNFKSDEKKTFKVSRDHMKLIQIIKENGFDGKKYPQSTCFMCHRGKLHPDFKEPESHKAQ